MDVGVDVVELVFFGYDEVGGYFGMFVFGVGMSFIFVVVGNVENWVQFILQLQCFFYQFF